MTDVFISYAHEDQPFVRRMTRALEAEGFSVWWDHTIPPGKTWNTYIARGIAEAKACIVVWSKHSVASKWVLEEATLASNADKLLPVSVDASAPPMGFLSLQSAQLAGWSGDTNNAQWRLLSGEVRALARRGSDTLSASTPSTHAAPPASAPRPFPWPLLGAIGATIVAGLVAFAIFARAPQDVAVETATTEAPSTDAGAAPPSDAGAADMTAPPINSAAEQTPRQSPPGPQDPSFESAIAGDWRLAPENTGGCNYLPWRFAVSGQRVRLTHRDGATFELAVVSRSPVVLQPSEGIRWEFNGDNMTTYTSDGRVDCRVTRR